MPPIPIIGNCVLRYTLWTLAKAIGLMAGPVRPPWLLVRRGCQLSMSTAMPISELINDRASAPPCSAARAIATMSVTFGDSLAITGRLKTRFTSATVRSVSCSLWPISIPPWSTLGQLIFSSTMSTASWSLSLAQTSTYSVSDEPATLTMTFVPWPARNGIFSSMNRSMPTLARPMALSMPAVVSAVRGGGWPSRGWAVIDLVTSAPSFLRGKTRASSSP